MLTDFLCHTQPSVATTTYFDVYYYFNLKHVRAMFCEVSGTFLALATDPVFHALGAYWSTVYAEFMQLSPAGCVYTVFICVVYGSLACHTATELAWITQCYLPPDRGDIPAFTLVEAGTRLSDPGGMQG